MNRLSFNSPSVHVLSYLNHINRVTRFKLSVPHITQLGQYITKRDKSRQICGNGFNVNTIDERRSKIVRNIVFENTVSSDF